MYAKVFRSLWDGSMRGMPDEQLVFVYMLAHANEDGEVDIIVSKIADDTGLSEEDVSKAVATLEAPDPRSRSANDEGRRLLPLYEHGAWGWRIANYEFYRSIRNAEERRRQNREAQARYKAKQRAMSTAKLGSAESAQVEVEVEAEEVSQLPCPPRVDEGHSVRKERKADSPRDAEWRESFPLFWEEYPKRQKRPDAERAWMRVPLREQGGMDQILAGLERWKRSGQWARDDGQYIPLPATWLNARQYDDIPEVDLAL